MSGKGVFLEADGTRYEGEWIDGRLAGFGVKSRPDGSRYEGEWVDGKM